MKYLESHFEDYLKSVEKFNLHDKIETLFNDSEEGFDQKRNIILYVPPGIGKYSQALKYISEYSDSKLKYERKMIFNFHNKKEFLIKISDIHFEIDMELLGCNAKVLWNDIYYQILEILKSRPNHNGIILCKNFNCIHSELLEIFYSYMQTLTHKNIHLHYVFLTESVSFLPDNILNRCKVISLKRPIKQKYKKCVGKHFDKNIDITKILNIKDLKNKNTQLYDPYHKITNEIIQNILHYENIDFLKFRENLYNIFIYHLDVTQCLNVIIKYLFDNQYLKDDKSSDVYFELAAFLKLYNNNYRPIYHLEKFMFYLCKTIHEF